MPSGLYSLGQRPWPSSKDIVLLRKWWAHLLLADRRKAAWLIDAGTRFPSLFLRLATAYHVTCQLQNEAISAVRTAHGMTNIACTQPPFPSGMRSPPSLILADHVLGEDFVKTVCSLSATTVSDAVSCKQCASSPLVLQQMIAPSSDVEALAQEWQDLSRAFYTVVMDQVLGTLKGRRCDAQSIILEHAPRFYRSADGQYVGSKKPSRGRKKRKKEAYNTRWESARDIVPLWPWEVRVRNTFIECRLTDREEVRSRSQSA